MAKSILIPLTSIFILCISFVIAQERDDFDLQSERKTPVYQGISSTDPRDFTTHDMRQHERKVADFITPDGKFDLKAVMSSGYEGNISLEGYNVSFHAGTGEPVALPRQSAESKDHPDDVFWDNSISPAFPGTNGGIYAITMYNGQLIVGGSFTAAGRVTANNVAAWNGNSWSTLGTGMNLSVNAFTVYNNKLVAGGNFTLAGGGWANYIASWDGFSWSPLGSGMNWSVNALAVYDNKLIAGGNFTTAWGFLVNRIASWDGSSWSPLGTGMNGNVKSLTVYDNKLIAAGEFTTAGDNAANLIASWDGSSWSPLGSGLGNYGYYAFVGALAVFNNKLVAGGYFTTSGIIAVNHIAAWDGSSWSPLGTGMDDGVSALMGFGDKLIAGGGFGEAGGSVANRIAMWDGSSWSPMATGMSAIGPDAWISALTAFDNKLIAGGDFNIAGNVGVSNVAAWDGSSWLPLGLGMNGQVSALSVYNNELIAGGQFTTVGGIAACCIAGWNGSSWSPLGSGMNGSVLALTVYDNKLIAGGYFTTAGGAAASHIASWNGTAWSPLGSGANNAVRAFTMYNNDLVAGGDFNRLGTVLANKVAVWNGYSWSPLGSGVNNSVYALAVYGSKLIAGGIFTVAGGVAADRIAAWNGLTWTPLGSGIGGVEFPSINAFTIYDNKLIAGGNFLTAGGVVAWFIAAWNGAYWSSVGPGINNSVSALAVDDDKLIAGGSFTAGAGPIMINRVASWDGSSWAELGSGIGGNNPYVAALTTYESKLIVGGSIAWAGDKVSAYLARWTKGAQSQQHVLTIRDGTPSQNPIPNKEFELIKVTNNPPIMTEELKDTLTTDNNGMVTLPDGWFVEGDMIKVKRLIHTELARKHTDLMPNMFYITVDNAQFEESGAISYDIISSSANQDIVLDHTTITYDLLVSIEWDADQVYLSSLEAGLRLMSNYLYDVTDGQMYVNQVKIYDNEANWNEADVQIHAGNMEWPHGDVGLGESCLAGGVFAENYDSHIYFPRIAYSDNPDANRNLSYQMFPYDWTTFATMFSGIYSVYPAIRTLAHEFGHYGIGFRDEYRDQLGNVVLPNYEFGMMDMPLRTGIPQNSEMSSTIQYADPSHQITLQWTERKRSCWDYFQCNYQGTYDGIYAPITKPISQMLAGPNETLTALNFDVGMRMVIDTINSDGGAFTKDVKISNRWGQSLKNSVVFLFKNNLNRVIKQGNTADNGRIYCLGANCGDIVRAYSVISNSWHSGELTLCSSAEATDKNGFDANADSLDLVLDAVYGDYPMIHSSRFENPDQFYYQLRSINPFTQSPTLEFISPDHQFNNFNFAQTSSGYEAMVNVPLGWSGLFSVKAVDDSAKSFYIDNSYKVTVFVDTTLINVADGSDGLVELVIDTSNATIQKILILSSHFPPMLNGIESTMGHVGAVHSISGYPDIVSLNGTNNYIIIRYSDADLQSGNESDLRIFKWEDVSSEWVIVGGSVDTSMNEVHSPIVGLGTYTLFTTVYGFECGDANGNGVVNILDVTYLISYLYKGGPTPDPMESGDANGNGVVNILDVTYLIGYLYKGGPAPICP